jgi:tRNA (guanine-N(7)-)-methyltransferase subunit TRM82
MLHTYQCLLYCPRPDQPDAATILAASGPCIHTFSVLNGNHLSSWPPYQDSEQNVQDSITRVNTDTEQSATGVGEATAGPPQKRRKLSSAREDSGSSAEIVVGNDSKDDGGSDTKRYLSLPIANLACTATGHHIVAVTGEDKCIRVFELTAHGILRQLSER